MSQQHFIPDHAETASQQNLILSRLMAGVWHEHQVISIKRAVFGSAQGWLLIYRD